ncbi:intradiol ring-cleavage dioxygenase [Christiangramia aquimixticola]|uniref:intradiol ring-cleavage dioxygenase n=1 Tax=Christiangramia aquimixticola TaxID=1697558 RepID=UPI003AA89A40
MIARPFLLVLSLFLFSCVNSQENPSARLVGGPCEGCEAIFDYGQQKLNSIDTLPGFESAVNKLKVSGTIYKSDGKTPAPNIILYLYQTNAEGLYAPAKGAEGWARRHGKIRGWLKTGADGKYAFYTHIPGNYPGSEFAAHIHPTILEPDGKYYYIQDYLFENDPYVEQGLRENPRGGTDGVLRLKKENGILVGKRDLILSKNISPYN